MRTKQQRSFSEDDKAAWRTAKQERLTNLSEQLKQEVAAVQDSEVFKRYLAAQAVFHHYSARNVFLMLFQRPEATRVAGYSTWQKLGRQVRRGETGITIFAPAPFKQSTTDTTTGEVTEELIPRFKTATVFDIAQTVGEPLPTIKLGEITGRAPEGAYTFLVDFAVSIGYTMVPHPEDDEAEGRCNYEQRSISVQTATPERMLHVLVHELAHALTAAIRQVHDRTERETIAEGVAFVTCTAIGLDAGGYAFPLCCRLCRPERWRCNYHPPDGHHHSTLAARARQLELGGHIPAGCYGLKKRGINSRTAMTLTVVCQIIVIQIFRFHHTK